MSNQLDSFHSLQGADICWQCEGTPRSQHYDDVYFSRSRGLEESRHVFLAGNQLARRWRQLPKDAHFIIIEAGFGTGLNFLAAWQLWRQTAISGARLHYLSIEKHPLTPADLDRALSQWPELKALTNRLLHQYPPALPGLHCLDMEDGVQLTLGFGEIIDVLADICDCDHPQLRRQLSISADAWFLDGFAPAKNPAMWSEPVMQSMAALSAPGTSFATFTAAGQVRRRLQRVGFAVRKAPGFGPKRDMLCGAFDGPADASPAPGPDRGCSPAWHCAAQPASFVGRHALVIGAGLAGCHSARALADSGWQVTVLEQAAHCASAASGNPSGILYSRLSSADSDQAAFSLNAYLYASRHYRSRFDRQQLRTGIDGNLNGMLQLGFNAKERHNIAAIGARYRQFGELVRYVSAAEASELAGLEIEHPALFFATSGWLHPAAVCRQLLDHDAITLRGDSQVSELRPWRSAWRVLTASGDALEAPLCVISCGVDSSRFALVADLPLRGIGGQITRLPGADRAPLIALCHSGYVAPMADGELCCGASFRSNDAGADLRAADHRHNLQQLSRHLPSLLSAQALEGIEIDDLQGRAAVRCTTPDYLPIVGPVPRLDAMRRIFKPLARNARAHIDQPGEYWPGLYINTGHGSKGLATTPIAAACIAALANRTPRPLPWRLQRALSPSRFAIRALIRGQH